MPQIEFNNQTKSHACPRKQVAQTLRRADKYLRIRKTQIVSLAFVSPAAIRRLNKIYRRKDKVTDVLSFGGEDKFPGEKILGEIIICPSRAAAQARTLGHSFNKEIARLALHGYLHLQGFDHVKKAEAEEMERIEELIINN